MIRALLMELERWNNSRAVVCRDCGHVKRVRVPLAYLFAEHHTNKHGHMVKVKRFG